MTQLVCPFCGPRDLHEFEFRKTVSGSSQDPPFARVYLRVDQPDRSIEHWQHSLGCRAWLLLHRNPSSDAILGVRFLGDDGS